MLYYECTQMSMRERGTPFPSKYMDKDYIERTTSKDIKIDWNGDNSFDLAARPL